MELNSSNIQSKRGKSGTHSRASRGSGAAVHSPPRFRLRDRWPEAGGVQAGGRVEAQRAVTRVGLGERGGGGSRADQVAQLGELELGLELVLVRGDVQHR